MVPIRIAPYPNIEIVFVQVTCISTKFSRIFPFTIFQIPYVHIRILLILAIFLCAERSLIIEVLHYCIRFVSVDNLFILLKLVQNILYFALCSTLFLFIFDGLQSLRYVFPKRRVHVTAWGCSCCCCCWLFQLL